MLLQKVQCVSENGLATSVLWGRLVVGIKKVYTEGTVFMKLAVSCLRPEGCAAVVAGVLPNVNNTIELPAVPLKWFGSADCDTLCTIFLSIP